MSIKAELNNLEMSTLYRLVFEGNILGFRAKYYSIKDKKFYYYDFELSYIKRPEFREYITANITSFQELPLIRYNDLVCTQDEIDGTVSVREFKDADNIHAILSIIIKVLEQKGVQ